MQRERDLPQWRARYYSHLLLDRSWRQGIIVLSILLESWWWEGLLPDSWSKTESLYWFYSLEWRDPRLCAELPGVQNFCPI